MASLLDEEAYSGLERLLRAMRGEAPDVPMLRLLGIEIDEVEHGRIVLRCRPTEEHLNRVGTIHGGYTASVLDTAAALCFLSTHEPGERSTTADLTIKYIRPLLPGMDLAPLRRGGGLRGQAHRCDGGPHRRRRREDLRLRG